VGPGPQTLSASAFLNPDADETAHIFGLDSALQRLLALQSQRPVDVPPTLAELSARQELLELVQVSFRGMTTVDGGRGNADAKSGRKLSALAPWFIGPVS
jgi:hypothetical protein